MTGEPLVRAAPEGATLKVRVAPGARRERIVGVHGDALKVAVAAPPEKGRANDAVIRLLAKALGVPPAQVVVARGPGSRDKVLLFRGLSPEELRRRIAAGAAGW